MPVHPPIDEELTPVLTLLTGQLPSGLTSETIAPMQAAMTAGPLSLQGPGPARRHRGARTTRPGSRRGT